MVIDLFSRQVVGWSLGERMTWQLVMDALRMAWFRRGPDKRSGFIFHSDRGSQYCSSDFQDMLKGYGMRFETRRAAKDEVIDWLLWYDSRRLPSTLGYISPMQYEQRGLSVQPKTANM